MPRFATLPNSARSAFIEDLAGNIVSVMLRRALHAL